MATDQYKKSYEGDYTKSYKDFLVWKMERIAQKKEYETISKKLNEQPYNKKERSASYENSTSTYAKETDRVFADGSSRQRDRGEIRRNWDESRTYTPTKPTTTRQQPTTSRPATPQNVTPQQTTVEQPRPTVEPQRQIDYKLETKEEVAEQKINEQYIPPVFQEKRVDKKPWKNAYEIEEEEEDEDDGNYNYHAIPIEKTATGRYKNLKTGKEIGIDQARVILNKAGFEPKPNNNMGTAFFIFLIANVMLPIVAPLVAVGYGFYRMKVKETTWVKGAGNQAYKVSLPASESELTVNKTFGRIAIILGIIVGIFRYSSYF